MNRCLDRNWSTGEPCTEPLVHGTGRCSKHLAHRVGDLREEIAAHEKALSKKRAELSGLESAGKEST